MEVNLKGSAIRHVNDELDAAAASCPEKVTLTPTA